MMMMTTMVMMMVAMMLTSVDDNEKPAYFSLTVYPFNINIQQVTA